MPGHHPPNLPKIALFSKSSEKCCFPDSGNSRTRFFAQALTSRPLFFSAPPGAAKQRLGGRRPPERSFPWRARRLAPPHSCANEARTRRVSAVFLTGPRSAVFAGRQEAHKLTGVSDSERIGTLWRCLVELKFLAVMSTGSELFKTSWLSAGAGGKMMKVQRTISLDERTAKIAGSMDNLSEWVRARLLAWDEGTLDEFAEALARMATPRLMAMTLRRLTDNRDQPIDMDAVDPVLAIRGWFAGKAIGKIPEVDE